MDPAEIRVFRKVLIKEKGAEVFRKIRPYPILWEAESPLKILLLSYSYWQFEKISATHFLMTTYRMNEPNFGRIHLTGQYLANNPFCPFQANRTWKA
jgi:hypothetical protein